MVQTTLSEAQSEVDRQDLRMHCADRAIHESGIQLHSQRMELCQANQLSDQSHSEKSWSCTELESCTEAERAKQLRIDELSTQEKESKSSVNQLMVQIQELQDNVNSLSDARDISDPETASSSG